MSHPIIVLHLTLFIYLFMETQSSDYKKWTQKNYSLNLKLHIVQENKQGSWTTTGVLDKYGIQTASNVLT